MLLSAQPYDACVVATSGGNHGAALAFAASRLGIKSTIYVPDFAGPLKIERMREFGADVIVTGNDVSEAIKEFRDHADRTGAMPVHPFDGPAVIAGQGTVALELLAQSDDLDAVLVSVGGGGLAAGCAAWLGKRVRLVGVETAGTSTYATTLHEGGAATTSPEGLAASALGAPSLGRIPSSLLRDVGAASIVVTDADVLEAQRRLWDVARLIVEPGAAAALAALVSGAYAASAAERVKEAQKRPKLSLARAHSRWCAGERRHPCRLGTADRMCEV